MTDKKRRQFVTYMGASSVTIPVTALLGSRIAHAMDLPLLDETSETAKSWNYVAVSATAGENCSGCTLYQGEVNAESGPCALFPDTHVATAGWCKQFIAKAS